MSTPTPPLSRWLTLLMAVGTGNAAASNNYNHTLLQIISQSVDLS